MTAIVAYAQDGGVTHVRNPRWRRLTLCDRVVMYTGHTSTPQRITCTRCSRLQANTVPSQRQEDREERKAGAETVDCWLRCSCGHTAERSLVADQPLRAALRELSCRSCGETGTCALAPLTDSLTPHAQ